MFYGIKSLAFLLHETKIGKGGGVERAGWRGSGLCPSPSSWAMTPHFFLHEFWHLPTCNACSLGFLEKRRGHTLMVWLGEELWFWEKWREFPPSWPLPGGVPGGWLMPLTLLGGFLGSPPLSLSLTILSCVWPQAAHGSHLPSEPRPIRELDWLPPGGTGFIFV